MLDYRTNKSNDFMVGNANIAENKPEEPTRPLTENVAISITKFLNNPENADTDNLYEIVLSEVERPLFTKVMQHVRGNQTKAAKLMGINRGTLRKKLKMYGLG